MKNPVIIRAVLGMTLLVALTGSCSADSVSTPIPDVAGSLIVEQVAPGSSTARAGSVPSDTFVVRVIDKRTSRPVAGAAVRFILGPGGGSMERYDAVTDASGLASPGKWQMGTGVGTRSVAVLVNGIKTIFLFSVTPDVPASIRQFTPAAIVGLTGETVSGPNVVVVDRFGNPIPNVPVRLSVTAGDAEVISPVVMTGISGSTTTSVRLGSRPGDVAVLITVDGIEPDRFAATALDPAGVSYYTLESVRQFDVMKTPGAVGVSAANLTISNFDRCLCRKESGYLILDIGYALQPSFEVPRRAGKFAINPGGITIAAGDFFAIKLVDGGIELGIIRDDLDDRWSETWIFKRTSGTS
ncbi:MAG TPA: Ig-like domain-containing protein [Gemmatimonadaceae bacterium]|nr:Ig-like domain-containing protein [Gemmatimonadaceae bacterium]